MVRDLTKVSPIADAHNIVRKVAKSRIVVDQLTGERVPLPSAFELRVAKGEDYLSASWLEFFSDNPDIAMKETVKILRHCTKISPGEKCGFAVGNVAAIRETCSRFSRKIRVVHEKGKLNPAYAAVRQIGPNDLELMDELAKGPWRTIVSNTDHPEYP